MSSLQPRPGDARDDGPPLTQTQSPAQSSKAETTWADLSDEEDKDLIDQAVQRTKDRLLSRLQESTGTKSSEMETPEHKSRPWSDATLVDTIRHSYWKGIAEEADRKREKEAQRACEACRLVKIRCDGKRPCSNCAALALPECAYRSDVEHSASTGKPKSSRKDRKRLRKPTSSMKRLPVGSSSEEKNLDIPGQRQHSLTTTQKTLRRQENADDKIIALPVRVNVDQRNQYRFEQISREQTEGDGQQSSLAQKNSEKQANLQALEVLSAGRGLSSLQGSAKQQGENARQGTQTGLLSAEQPLTDNVAASIPQHAALLANTSPNPTEILASEERQFLKNKLHIWRTRGLKTLQTGAQDQDQNQDRDKDQEPKQESKRVRRKIIFVDEIRSERAPRLCWS